MLTAGLLAAITVLAYLPVARNGFVWDDDHYVTGNPELRTRAGLVSIWFHPTSTGHTYNQYYPLVHTLFWVEYHLWQLEPLGYHLVNVLLHALGAVLLWRVLVALRVPGALFAAAVFAVHPVHVESVAWITERKNVLSGVFYFAAALAWLRFAGLDALRPDAQGRWRWYGIALVLFTCALLSKTVACTLPVAALLALWWKRGRVSRRDVMLLLPFVTLGLALGLMTVWLERERVGAVGAEWALSPIERMLVATRALWFYAGKLAWPGRLTFIYPRWDIDASQWQAWMFGVAALLVVVALWVARRRLGRGPLTAVLCYVVALGPALGFVNVYPMRYSFVADHFQYLASAALIALGAAMAARVALTGSPRIAAVGGTLIIGLLGALTWRQALIYENLDTLWRDTLAKNPGCWLAHNNFGMSLAQHGQLQDGIAHFEEALRLNPEYDHAHNNLGTAWVQSGRVQEGMDHLRQALAINPLYAEAHSNLGNALLLTGESTEAIAHFEDALRLQPDYADAHNNIALALMGTGQVIEAIGHFERAVAIQPELPQARARLGAAMVQAGRLPEAIRVLQDDVLHRPDEPAAHQLLAAAFAAAGRFDEAAATAEQALALASTAGHSELASAIAAQLEQYRAHRLAHDPQSSPEDHRPDQ